MKPSQERIPVDEKRVRKKTQTLNSLQIDRPIRHAQHNQRPRRVTIKLQQLVTFIVVVVVSRREARSQREHAIHQFLRKEALVIVIFEVGMVEAPDGLSVAILEVQIDCFSDGRRGEM